jgi:hypothetical protein
MVRADMKQYTDRPSISHPGNPSSSHIPRNSTLSSSFRNSSHPLPDNPRMGCCIFCGDRSKSQPSQACTAECYAIVSPCHLSRQEPSSPRTSRSGKRYCYAWNGPSAVTRPLAAGANISAPSAAPAHTTPNSARWSPDLLIVNTPFIPDEAQ